MQSEEKFKNLSNLTFEGILIHDKGIVIDANHSLLKMFNYELKELIGKNSIQLLIPEKYHKIISENIIKNYALPYEVEGIKKDGFTFPMEIEARFIITENENPSIRVTAFRDISLRKKTETEIRKLSTAVEQSANTVIITDTKRNIEYTNPKFSELTGYTAQEVYGRNPRFLNAGTQPKEYYTELWHTITAGEIWKGEFHNKKKNGDLFWEQVTITPIKDEVGEIINYLAIKEDITARKKTDQELLISKEKAEESDRLKTEFIHNMSHEIRTPMNGILGFSRLLSSPGKSEEKRKQYINIILNSGEQLMRIIEDILEISQLGTKQVLVQNEEVCLNDLLLALLSNFDVKAKEQQIPLYLRKGLSDKESTIFTDKAILNKILSNLLVNAQKFTNVGSIEFGYTLVKTTGHAFLNIYVKDTGIGIASDKQEIIFGRFSQEEKELSRKVGGLGLGLSIAQENAELLGGKVTLKSEKGKGATFFVTIPYKPVNSELEISEFSNYKGKITGKQDKYTILIVEDEEVNYLYIETLLENETALKCEIFHAKNGQEAVEMCKNNPEIDFALMDLKMPVMNGFEATKLIKAFRPDLPIVAQTAYSTKEDREKAKSAGCDDFISKPISEETFNEMIKKYLSKK